MLFFAVFLSSVSHPRPPARAVAGVIAVGLFDVKEELFPAFLVRDLTDFGGQALALEQLQFIVELFLGIKSIQLGPSTRPSSPTRRQRKAVSPPLPQVASMQSLGSASRAARKSCTSFTAVRSGVRRRHRPLPSAAKPNFAQKASSPASAGRGAVNTVALSLS